MNNTLKNIKSGLVFFVSVIIIIILCLQQLKIGSLTRQLQDCSTTVYIHNTDTIRDTIVDYTVIELPTEADPEYIEMVSYIQANLSRQDSLDIAQKIIDQITDYNSHKRYENVFKDDSSAYIQILADVYQNKILNPEVIFQNRYPIYQYRETKPATEIYAGIGVTNMGPTVSAGVMTRRRTFYQAQYDPVNKYYGININFGIFKFKNKQ